MTALCLSAILAALQLPTTPQPSPADSRSAHEHAAAVDERGDRVMGFDHAKTTHHFRLSRDGGSIEVDANDPQDVESRDRIRAHLSQIATAFARGDFDSPMAIHGEVPPGVAVLKKRRSEIRYEFAPTARGGRITIRTKSREARRAAHEFLRYQIREHRTGDSDAASSLWRRSSTPRISDEERVALVAPEPIGSRAVRADQRVLGRAEVLRIVRAVRFTTAHIPAGQADAQISRQAARLARRLLRRALLA